MSPEELHKKLEEARQELFNLRVRAATRQLDNVSAIAKAKKDIARMLTIQRELAGGELKGDS